MQVHKTHRLIFPLKKSLQFKKLTFSCLREMLHNFLFVHLFIYCHYKNETYRLKKLNQGKRNRDTVQNWASLQFGVCK